MPIVKDHSNMPSPARTRHEGRPPDPNPRFAHLLAEGWQSEDVEAGDRPRAKAGARFRHSDAGGCARAIAYSALGVPVSNPMDLAGVFTVRLGTLVHDAWQAELKRRYPGAEVEVKVGSGERAGHIDAVVRIPAVDGERGTETPGTAEPISAHVVAIEGKTVGGFAYKLAVGERGAPQGPKQAHIVQAALNAAEVDADEAVVVYWSKDSISVQAAERKRIDELTRFCAEWTFSRDEYLPIAEAERTRVDGILALLDEDTLPSRKHPELPAGAVITDPRSGQWQQSDGEGQMVDAGTHWACGYCRYQDTCTLTPAGRTPISEVAVTIGVPA